MKLQEKHLFPPLKKHFNELGYKVYAEVPAHYRCVDFVAVKQGEHIAVEMKMNFTKEVIRQANSNRSFFHKCYVAVPTKIRKTNTHIEWCTRNGIGILQVFPKGTILYVEEALPQKIVRDFDFSTFEELESDEAGLPFQKGKSSAFLVLDRIKKYVTEHPTATWKEIYSNVQSHYSCSTSMSQSMGQWKGFSLPAFKATLSKTVTFDKTPFENLPLFEI